MAIKKATKERIAAATSALRKWTFESQGIFDPKGTSSFLGKVKDEKGRIVLSIREDDEYNQVSMLLNKSRYMRSVNDMKGLAQYLWDRNLVPMKPEEREEWKEKNVVPLDIKFISVV